MFEAFSPNGKIHSFAGTRFNHAQEGKIESIEKQKKDWPYLKRVTDACSD